MKLNRLVAFGVFLTVTVSLCMAFRATDDDEERKEEKPGFFPILHQNHPRVFGIFSKPPEKDAPKQTGPSIIGHLGNVLQGGSIGIELSPLGTLIDHAKKILPGGRGTVGQPNHEKPDDPPPKKDWEMKKPDKELVKEPMKEPEPGFNWDDIGEDIEQFEPSTEKPIEELIDPRVRPKRPKRFIESKIYHVPLTFRSNAKPYKVVERNQNSLESKEKM